MAQAPVGQSSPSLGLASVTGGFMALEVGWVGLCSGPGVIWKKK